VRESLRLYCLFFLCANCVPILLAPLSRGRSSPTTLPSIPVEKAWLPFVGVRGSAIPNLCRTQLVRRFGESWDRLFTVGKRRHRWAPRPPACEAPTKPAPFRHLAQLSTRPYSTWCRTPHIRNRHVIDANR